MLFIIGLDLDLIHLLKRDYCGEEIYYLDKFDKKLDDTVLYYGDDKKLINLEGNKNFKFVFGTDKVDVKKNLDNSYQLNYLNIISSQSLVSEKIKLGKGVIVQDKVYISGSCSIGDLVKLNVGCQIHHNVYIGNLVTVAPGAILLGGVKIDDECFIGAGAILLPGVQLGKGCVVGAGSVVTKNFQNYARIKGVPAKPF